MNWTTVEPMSCIFVNYHFLLSVNLCLTNSENYE